jgi:tRNA pseudouridine13 synthase
VSSVGYAGLKDRRAVTTQWFTVHLVNRPDPDWQGIDAPGVEVLEVHRHRRKLRRGVLRGNRFLIRVRGLRGDGGLLEERLARVARLGVPNYFGGQRFGNRDGNLAAADALFGGRARRAGRHLRGLWVSAARSQLFNELLAVRVRRGDWDQGLPGDRMLLDGSRSHFPAEVVDAALRQRLCAFDVHPSGPLWGAGEPLVTGEPAALESAVAGRFPAWVRGLAGAGLRQERRALRLVPAGVAREVTGDRLELAFDLPAGAYATAVLREVVDWAGEEAEGGA